LGHSSESSKGFFGYKRDELDTTLRILGVRCCHTCTYYKPGRGCSRRVGYLAEEKPRYKTLTTPQNRWKWRMRANLDMTYFKYMLLLGCKCSDWK